MSPLTVFITAMSAAESLMRRSPLTLWVLSELNCDSFISTSPLTVFTVTSAEFFRRSMEMSPLTPFTKEAPSVAKSLMVTSPLTLSALRRASFAGSHTLAEPITLFLPLLVVSFMPPSSNTASVSPATFSKISSSALALRPSCPITSRSPLSVFMVKESEL